MATQIQIRRGLASEWTTKNPTLAEGELGTELDTGKWKTGNGITDWNHLGYAIGQGQSGTSGTSGTAGTSGVNGTSGTSGESGTSGTSGINGTSGTSGLTGQSGTSGTSGTTGTSGESGTSGTSGASGTNGTSGTSGTAGTSGLTAMRSITSASFTSSATWSFNHGLGQKYPIFQVYNSEDITILPSKIKVIDNNTVYVYFDVPQAGLAVASS